MARTYNIKIRTKDSDMMDMIIDHTMFNNMKKYLVLHTTRNCKRMVDDFLTIDMGIIDNRDSNLSIVKIMHNSDRELSEKYITNSGFSLIQESKEERENVRKTLHEKMGVILELTMEKDGHKLIEPVRDIYEDTLRQIQDTRQFKDQDIRLGYTDGRLIMEFTLVNAGYPMLYF